jgi:hypothetical protein
MSENKNEEIEVSKFDEDDSNDSDDSLTGDSVGTPMED